MLYVQYTIMQNIFTSPSIKHARIISQIHAARMFTIIANYKKFAHHALVIARLRWLDFDHVQSGYQVNILSSQSECAE